MRIALLTEVTVEILHEFSQVCTEHFIEPLDHVLIRLRREFPEYAIRTPLRSLFSVSTEHRFLVALPPLPR